MYHFRIKMSKNDKTFVIYVVEFFIYIIPNVFNNVRTMFKSNNLIKSVCFTWLPVALSSMETSDDTSQSREGSQ